MVLLCYHTRNLGVRLFRSDICSAALPRRAKADNLAQRGTLRVYADSDTITLPNYKTATHETLIKNTNESYRIFVCLEKL